MSAPVLAFTMLRHTSPINEWLQFIQRRCIPQRIHTQRTNHWTEIESHAIYRAFWYYLVQICVAQSLRIQKQNEFLRMYPNESREYTNTSTNTNTIYPNCLICAGIQMERMGIRHIINRLKIITFNISCAVSMSLFLMVSILFYSISIRWLTCQGLSVLGNLWKPSA